MNFDTSEMNMQETTKFINKEENLILFIYLDVDYDAENPLEIEDRGKIYSFSRRHSNFLELDACTREEAEASLKEKFPYFITLGYFEHGVCNWHISEEKPLGTEGDYRWDGCSFAGAWVPSDSVIAGIKGMNKEDRAAEYTKRARHDCEAYTAWANGEVYYINVQAFTLREDEKSGKVFDRSSDYRFQEPLYLECYGDIYLKDYYELIDLAEKELTFCYNAVKQT